MIETRNTQQVQCLIRILETIVRVQPPITPNAQLLRGVMAGNLDAVQRLLQDKSVDPNTKDENGTPALTLAVMNTTVPMNTQLEIVKSLLQKEGVDVEAKDKDGETAAVWAVWIRSLPILRELRNHGARVDTTDRNGDSLLTLAQTNGFDEIVADLT